ncbi:MAG TPA: hypothetical protein VGI78_03865 [Acetobacteraceae bacterium]
MTDAPHAYTGKLYRGSDEGTVRGFLVDTMGTRLELSGVRDPRGGGYLLVGRVVLPAHLEVDGLDTP